MQNCRINRNELISLRFPYGAHGMLIALPFSAAIWALIAFTVVL